MTMLWNRRPCEATDRPIAVSDPHLVRYPPAVIVTSRSPYSHSRMCAGMQDSWSIANENTEQLWTRDLVCGMASTTIDVVQIPPSRTLSEERQQSRIRSSSVTIVGQPSPGLSVIAASHPNRSTLSVIGHTSANRVYTALKPRTDIGHSKQCVQIVKRYTQFTYLLRY